MADFPVVARHKPVISTFAPESSLTPANFSLSGGSAGVSAVWPSANLAIYIPFMIASPYLVRKVWWANGATVGNGNADAGVYTLGGAQLLHAGATATANAGVVQSVTLGTAVLLNPGTYYMGLSLASASDTIWRVNPAAGRFIQAAGAFQQTSAEPLPSTATFAAYAQSYVPLFGIANATTI